MSSNKEGMVEAWPLQIKQEVKEEPHWDDNDDQADEEGDPEGSSSSQSHPSLNDDSDQMDYHANTPGTIQQTPMPNPSAKSAKLYEKTYREFQEWRKDVHKSADVNEDTLIAYFDYRYTVKNCAASTLIPVMSMVRYRIAKDFNINIKDCGRLRQWINGKVKGYEPKRWSSFTKDEILRFLTIAPDKKFLLHKVCTILALNGLSKTELMHLDRKDVQYEEESQSFKIHLRNMQTSRLHSIRNPKFVEKLFKYWKLVIGTPGTRFLRGYRDGRIIATNLGINTQGSQWKAIATFLKLQNPETYSNKSLAQLKQSRAEVTKLTEEPQWNSLPQISLAPLNSIPTAPTVEQNKTNGNGAPEEKQGITSPLAKKLATLSELLNENNSRSDPVLETMKDFVEMGVDKMIEYMYKSHSFIKNS